MKIVGDDGTKKCQNICDDTDSKSLKLIASSFFHKMYMKYMYQMLNFVCYLFFSHKMEMSFTSPKHLQCTITFFLLLIVF